MKRYKLNIKLIVFLAIGFVVFVGSVHFLHGYQVRRNSGSLREAALEAKANGDLRKAKDNYSRYLRLQPDDEQAQVDLANALVDLAESGTATFEEMNLAYSRLETTVRNVPDDDKLRRRMVEFVMRYARPRLNDAIDHVQILLHGNPSDKELGFLYVQCLAGAKEFEQTVDLCSIMIGLDRTTSEFGGEPPDTVPDTWQETWKALWATGIDKEEIYVVLAMLLRDQFDNPELADRVMDQLIAANSQSFRAHLLRAAYLQRDDGPAAAKEDIKQALALEPNDADVILAAARMAIVEKDYDAARLHGQRGIEQHEDEERMYQMVAMVEIALKNTEAALSIVDRGLDKMPDSFNLLHYKVNLQLQAADLAGVRETIAVMEEKEFPAELRDFLAARLLMLDEKWLDASRQLELVRPRIMVTPNAANLGPKIDVLLGQCYERLGQNDVALNRYERAISAEPTLASAQIGARRLRSQISPATAQPSGPLQAEISKQLSLPEAQRDWSVVDQFQDRVIASRKLEGAQVEVLRSQFMVLRKQFGDARQILAKARIDYPNDLTVLLAAAKLTFDDSDGNLTQGLAILDLAEKQFGATAGVRVAKAQIYLRLGGANLRERLVALEEGIDSLSNVDQQAFWRSAGIIYHQAQMLTDSRRAYQHVADADPNDLPIRIKIFDLALADDDEEAIQKAQDNVLQLVGSEEDSTWRYCEVSRMLRRVRLDLEQRKERDAAVLAEAQKLVDQIIKTRPNWFQAYQLQAVINTLEGQFDTAIVNFNRAIDLGPPNPSLAYRLVHLLNARKRFAEAWDIMQLIPKAQQAFLSRKIVARVALETGHVDEALEAAKSAVALAPLDPEIHLWHAQILEVAQRGPQLEAELREAIRLNPRIERAWVALVAHLVHAGQMEKAEEELLGVRMSFPGKRGPVVLAQCSEVMGKREDAEKYYLEALEFDPNNFGLAQSMAAYYLGKNYYGSDGPVKASPYLAKILTEVKQKPGQINLTLMWARRESAKILASTGVYVRAVDALNVLDLNAFNGKLLRQDVLLKAGILASRSEPESRRRAIALFEQLAGAEPLTTGQQLVSAQLYFKADRWPECRRQMLDLLVREENNTKVLATFCGMLIEQGEIGEANIWLNNLERLDPKSTVTVGLRARVLTKQGNAQQAIATLTALLPQPIERNSKDLVLLGNIAQLLEDLEQYDAAEQAYRKLAELEPRAMLTLAGFLGRRGRTDEAFQAIDNVAPEELPLLVIKVATDLIRGRRHEVGSQYDQRIESRIDKVLRESPRATTPIMHLAVFRDLQQDYDEAERLYRDLLSREDVTGIGRATIENNLAFLLAMFGKDTDEAKKLVMQAIAMLGPSPELLDTRAMVSLAAGDHAAAIKDLKSVVSDVEKSTYYLHLAYVYFASGDKEAARTAYTKATELGLTPDQLHPLEQKRYNQLILALGLSPITSAG